MEQAIRVLLIEDDEDDYFLTAELLRESHARPFEITWADRLDKGLECVRRQETDVILLDLSLPDSQGLDTFLTLHEDSAHLPVILLTGLKDESVGMRAVQEGAQDYLVKGSIDSQLLVRAILYAIERKRTKEQMATYARELQARNEQMADDLNMAREVQQSFLPRQYPTFPAGVPETESALTFCHLYRPSTAVGGDFYAVLPVSDSCAGVFVCDVMGHGMRAALVTAIVRGLLEELKPIWSQPGTFLSELNAGLQSTLRYLDRLIFASAFYGTVDVQSERLSYASAGHPPPLHVRRKERQSAFLSLPDAAGGPALGIVEGYEYRRCDTRIAVRDLIVLYTDGVYEVRSPNEQEYGRERMLEIAHKHQDLPGSEFLERLVSDACLFSRDAVFEDDVCLVAVEVVRSGTQTERV